MGREESCPWAVVGESNGYVNFQRRDSVWIDQVKKTNRSPAFYALLLCQLLDKSHFFCVFREGPRTPSDCGGPDLRCRHHDAGSHQGRSAEVSRGRGGASEGQNGVGRELSLWGFLLRGDLAVFARMCKI